jgi:hypothetical protein
MGLDAAAFRPKRLPHSGNMHLQDIVIYRNATPDPCDDLILGNELSISPRKK